MADDSNKETGGGSAHKKGMPPLVLIAAGAVLGAAGVVFGVPPKTVEVVKEAPVHVVRPFWHPDLIEKTFNPETRAGKAVAKVSFRFEYTCREDRKEEVLQQMKDMFPYAESEVGKVLRRMSAKDLQTKRGEQLLEMQLLNALDTQLFHVGDAEAIAHVSRILIEDIHLQ